MTDMPKSSELTVNDDLKPLMPTPTLEERRAKVDAENKARLAGRLPSGYSNAVIRCDTEDAKGDQKPITPEVATKLLNAIGDLSARAGLTRPDEAPATPLDKDAGIDEDDPPPNPKKGADEDEDGETGLAKLTRMAEGLSQMLLKMNERLDSIEGKGKRKDAEEDEPEPVAADSQIGFEPKSEVLFSEAQARADKVYSAFGGNAAPPMSGESLMAYRRRLLRPLMSHSETFKDLDVGVASLDRKLFDTVERGVHNEAIAASRNPLNVVAGHLQVREQTRDGHIFRSFHGSPMVWMRTFMPAGKAVTKINLRPPHEPARW
jgi:hypothetical protein